MHEYCDIKYEDGEPCPSGYNSDCINNVCAKNSDGFYVCCLSGHSSIGLDMH
jgi:hypothetical protein